MVEKTQTGELNDALQVTVEGLEIEDPPPEPIVVPKATNETST